LCEVGIKTDFSKLAPIYDFLGTMIFLGALRRSQTCLLNGLPTVDNVLVLGGGTGTFLVDMLKKVSVSQIDYIDISQGMITQAKKKVVAAGLFDKVNFICGSEQDIPEKKYDLICTNYFLDCFSDADLLQLMPLLQERVADHGHWLFTDFHLQKRSSFSRKFFVGFLYVFFKVTCHLTVKKLPDFELHFEKLDLEKEQESYFSAKLLRSVLFKKM
jgi:tRNA (cmo5U34)-methyltransferase